MKRISVGLAAAVVSAVMVGCDALGVMGIGRAPSLTGDWIVQREDSIANMTLLEDGDALTGNFGVSFLMFPLKGTRIQNTVNATVTVNFMGETSSIKIAGEVSGDGRKITGTMKTDTIQRGEDGGLVTVPATESVAFTATKK